MIAGFIILRLRSIFRKKTGHETKAYPTFFDKNEVPKKDVEPLEQNLDVLEGMIKRILRGAEIAYESILSSFSNGDLTKPRPSSSLNIFSNFSDAIKPE